MPVMDGLTATRALRASDGPNAKTPVLALSADVMAADLERCREAGMNGHVAKPISVKALFAAVAEAAAAADGAKETRRAAEAVHPLDRDFGLSRSRTIAAGSNKSERG